MAEARACETPVPVTRLVLLEEHLWSIKWPALPTWTASTTGVEFVITVKIMPDPTNTFQLTLSAPMTSTITGCLAFAGNYGAVWFPSVGPGWAPYHNGHWVWVEPWGWTWVDEAPGDLRPRIMAGGFTLAVIGVGHPDRSWSRVPSTLQRWSPGSVAHT